jgi:hypothetical protein
MATTTRSKTARDLEIIGAMAIAAGLMTRSLLDAVWKKGLLSETEVAQLIAAATASAQRSGGSNRRLAALIAEEIGQYLPTPPGSIQH